MKDVQKIISLDKEMNITSQDRRIDKFKEKSQYMTRSMIEAELGLSNKKTIDSSFSLVINENPYQQQDQILNINSQSLKANLEQAFQSSSDNSIEVIADDPMINSVNLNEKDQESAYADQIKIKDSCHSSIDV